MNEPWRIELLGGLKLCQRDRTITRFRTQKTGSLLGYLVYHLDRRHSREVIVELLWPESDPQAGRLNLRVALNSLRHQLEPPGVPAGAVIVADRFAVGLNPDAVTTDVAEFESALQAASHAANAQEHIQHLTKAVELYQGDMLSGYYEEWILAEQRRLTEVFFRALSQLVRHLETSGDLEKAIDYARQGVSADPLREEAHCDLMRLYAASGQPLQALQQYRDLRRILKEALGMAPGPDTLRLVLQIEKSAVAGGGGMRTGERVPGDVRASVVGSQRPAARSSPPSQTGQASPSPKVDRTYGSHLPLQFTRFFGRALEAAGLQEMLIAEDVRLITLTGPGGSGKTRLALEVAGNLLEAFQGAVWFVPLADLTDARLIGDALASVLGITRSPNVEPLEQAIEKLSRQPGLLVLDNFEHLVEEGSGAVRILLERAPLLKYLVTSRQPLNLSGEREFRVLPLETPGGPNAPEKLMEYASVQLFLDRGQAVRPDFQVTPGNAAAVAELCNRLEGIPLALEIAATRIQVLTPGQMLAQLEHRFEFLVSRRRDVDERHRTLRGAIDWSYRLLAPELQRFFTRLSVFRGGCDLEGAEAVCGEPLALDYLARLIESSLVLAEEVGGRMRYRMLETIREYGQERLTPEEQSDVERRHAKYYLKLAEEAEPKLKSADQKEWLDRLTIEHDNLRKALEWSLREEGMQRLACGCRGLWDCSGIYAVSFLKEENGWKRHLQ